MALEPIKSVIQPNEQLIGQLKYLLSEAESGTLQSMVMAGDCMDRTVITSISIGSVSCKYSLIGAIERTKDRVFKELCDD